MILYNLFSISIVTLYYIFVRNNIICYCANLKRLLKQLKPPLWDRLYIRKYVEPFLMDQNSMLLFSSFNISFNEKSRNVGIRLGVGYMLLKECNRCGNLIPYGSAYCSTCTPIVQAEREARIQESKRESNRRYNKTRDPKYVRFYNGIEWRTLSAKYTQDKGYKCELCKRMATEVHHKKPIQTPEGWELRLDYNNLELLCIDCHNVRHDRFKKRIKYIRERPKGV